MKKTFIVLLVVTNVLQGCNAQPKVPPKEIFNNLFNWRITIPEGFTSVPAAQWMKMQNRGADAIEKTYETKVENRTKTIFVFKNDDLNYFESNYQPFDVNTDGDYLESLNGVNEILYGTFEAQMPDARLDSSSSHETIDGMDFHTFKVDITMPNGLVLQCLMYCRLFGKNEFSVSIMTVDKEKRRMLLEAWRSSTFSGKKPQE